MFFHRIITQVSCPIPISSLLLLKDGITMIGGGLDGMHYYCICALSLLFCPIPLRVGNIYVYNMRNCKEPSNIISAHHKPITALAAQNTVKVLMCTLSLLIFSLSLSLIVVHGILTIKLRPF